MAFSFFLTKFFSEKLPVPVIFADVCNDFSKQSADYADDSDFNFSKKFTCENLHNLRTVFSLRNRNPSSS